MSANKVCTSFSVDKAANGYVVNVSYEGREAAVYPSSYSQKRMVFSSHNALMSFLSKVAQLPEEKAEQLVARVDTGEKVMVEDGQIVRPSLRGIRVLSEDEQQEAKMGKAARSVWYPNIKKTLRKMRVHSKKPSPTQHSAWVKHNRSYGAMAGSLKKHYHNTLGGHHIGHAHWALNTAGGIRRKHGTKHGNVVYSGAGSSAKDLVKKSKYYSKRAKKAGFKLPGKKSEGISPEVQSRRYRRIHRMGHLFQGRIAPGYVKGASPAARAKADKTLAHVQRSAQRWTARGAKRGAGGRIRSDPAYMKRLIKSYSKKKMNLSPNVGKPGGGGYWKESVERFIEAVKAKRKESLGEAYQRARRLMGVRKKFNRELRKFRTGKMAGDVRQAKYQALRAAGVLARKVPTLKGTKGGRSRARVEIGKQDKIFRAYRKKGV